MTAIPLLRALAVAFAASRIAAGQPFVISTVAGGGRTPVPVLATEAAIQPSSVAIDPSGNLYFTGYVEIFKVDPTGMLTCVAGNGRRGYSGDGGSALKAQLTPGPIALAPNGDLYFIDTPYSHIRKVTAAGIISTIAGAGYSGFSGDGGPAAQAQLDAASALAIDSAGNLYIADSGNHRIRKITTDGKIQTIAGTGASGNTGDGGPASAATLGENFASLTGLAVDAAGALYVSADGRIRKIAPDGIITTIATAQTSSLSIEALALDASGNLYFSESAHYEGGAARVRKIAPDGTMSTVAGTGRSGFSGDGGPATSAQLLSPTGIALDRDGNLFVADRQNNRIRRVSANGIISTAAGNGRRYYVGDGGPAIAAQLDTPLFVAIHPAGGLLISEMLGQRLRRVSADGRITTIAGTGGPLTPGTVRDGQPAITANIGRIAGVAVDSKGNVYVSDSDNYCVWRIDSGGSIERFAGTGRRGPLNDGGPARSGGLVTPWGLALDRAGNLYIADENDHRIRKVARDGTISTVAGNGTRGFSGDGGPALQASLDWPQSVAIDADGALYIADYGNCRIRKVSTTGIITTVAGGDFGSTDCHGLPLGVALDGAGNLYFSAGSVYRMSPDGKVQSLAGADLSGFSSGYSGFRGLAVDSDGALYVADDSNGAVRRIDPVGPLSVVNAASGLSGAVAPGEIVTLYGAGIGPDELAVADGRFATELAGAAVYANGIACPLLYASATQVGAVVPYSVGSPVSLTVVFRGRPAGTVATVLRPAAPGVFTANARGSGQAAAVLGDTGQVNSAAIPARAGQVLTVFLTGTGLTSPLPADGEVIAGPPLPQVNLPVTATIGGRPAEVLYAGAAPGQIAALTQVNLRIPDQVGVGDVALVVYVGGTATQGGVTIALR